jgi:hypothetical protein
MREVFVLLRFKGPVKGTIEFFKDSALLDYTPDFIKDEFTGPLTVEKLCQAVEAEKLPFRLKSKENTIDRLNELLKLPDFYDKLTAAKTNAALSDMLKTMAGKTEEMRKDVPPLGLGTDDEVTVKKLNRLLMEEVYKDLTPKRRSPKAIDMKNLQIDRGGNDLVVVATFAAYKAEK